VYEEQESGVSAVTRPGRDALLERLEEYDALVVFKLDRRSPRRYPPKPMKEMGNR
jgi:DNA invertase Pin-like site-specific DNA recombinase